MNHVDIIYKNDFGISFFWQDKDLEPPLTVQLVFRDTGFYLSLEELKSFSSQTVRAITQGGCGNCKKKNTCRSLLLKTPSEKIDLAVSRNELNQIVDLLDQTIIKVEARNYLATSSN